MPNQIEGKNSWLLKLAKTVTRRRQCAFKWQTLIFQGTTKMWLYFPNFSPCPILNFKKVTIIRNSNRICGWTFCLTDIYLMRSIYQTFLFSIFLKHTFFSLTKLRQRTNQCMKVVGNISQRSSQRGWNWLLSKVWSNLFLLISSPFWVLDVLFSFMFKNYIS